MDVPAAALAAPPVPAAPAPTPAPVAVAPSTPAPAAIGLIGSEIGAPPSSAPAPVQASGPPSGQAGSNQKTDDTLTPVVAKLFNAREQNVQVSFQVQHDPDEVVTVFTDKSTGKEIVQFPSQALIALAEIYDKNAGKVLDKSV